jgi:hypothetical protein
MSPRHSRFTSASLAMFEMFSTSGSLPTEIGAAMIDMTSERTMKMMREYMLQMVCGWFWS